jgi:hypothetical protein
MSAVTVRIPDDLHQQLRDAAVEEHRSLNNLMLVLWREALKQRGAKKPQPQRS